MMKERKKDIIFTRLWRFTLYKMESLEKGDKNSKSLLTNVLDMDDDFIAGQTAAEKLVGLVQQVQFTFIHPNTYYSN